MRRSWIVPLTFLMFLAAGLVPAATAVSPEPLPFSADTTTFYISGIQGTAGDVTCSTDLNTAHGDSSGTVFPFASNNPSDPCRDPAATFERTINSDVANALGQSGTPGVFEVRAYPAFPANTELIEGEEIKGEVTLYLAGLTAQTPLTFGAIKPKIYMTIGETQIGTIWDGAADVDPTTMTPPTPSGDKIYETYSFSLGNAPAKVPNAGALKLFIDFHNVLGAEAQDLRFFASRVGLAVDEAHEGSFVFPVKPGTDLGGGGGGNSTGDNETNGNNTQGNGTEQPSGGNNTGGNQTTEPANTTATVEANGTKDIKTEDTPAVGLVGALAAGLVATVAWTRRRGPPGRAR